MMINYRIYSSKEVKEPCEIGSMSIGDTEYTAKINYHDVLNYDSDESRQVMGRLVKKFMMTLKLVKYGRKYFDPSKTTDFSQH